VLCSRSAHRRSCCRSCSARALLVVARVVARALLALCSSSLVLSLMLCSRSALRRSLIVQMPCTSIITIAFVHLRTHQERSVPLLGGIHVVVSPRRLVRTFTSFHDMYWSYTITPPHPRFVRWERLVRDLVACVYVLYKNFNHYCTLSLSSFSLLFSLFPFSPVVVVVFSSSSQI